jgi:hypothetical protein
MSEIYWSPTTGKVHSDANCASLRRGKINAVPVDEKDFSHHPKCKKCWTSKGKPTLISQDGKERICPNCGQYQHKGTPDYYDCVNMCVARGFANKVYWKPEYDKRRISQ